MRLTVVRHGETTGQSSIRYYGRTDVPLSDIGVEQMRGVAAALAHERFDAVFTSELQRSRDAAALVVGNGAIAIPEFNELDFGNWEGWTREEIAARDPDNYRLWQDRAEPFAYPGGDSRADFNRRVVRGLARLLESRPAGNWLMVLHRGVIATILTELLGLTRQRRRSLDIALGSIHVVSRRGDRWRSEQLDRIDHLCGFGACAPSKRV